jgi:hypothetical protein
MWYLGIGSSIRLNKSEKCFLHDIGKSLYAAGWGLRTGGRGDVDDALISGVSNPAKVDIILPHPQYRQYDITMPGVNSFGSLSESLRKKSFSLSERNHRGSKIISPLHKSLLGSSSSLVLGKTLEEPVKFAITMVEVGCEEDECCSMYSEIPVFNLLRNNDIPLFNLNYSPHKNRLIDFVCATKNKWPGL